MREQPFEWGTGSYLASLPPAARAALLELGVRRQFDSGRLLFREGERSSHVELLLRGYVKVTTVLEGVEALQSIRVPGDLLGETGSLGGRPRMATVTTCGRVVSSVITAADFRGYLRGYPEAAMFLTAALGERLRWANERRADFAAYPAEVRLARILLELAHSCGRPAGDGIAIGIPLSQPELATMVGIAEVTAQKAIRQLRRQGVIRTGYRQITVLDLDALRAIGA